MTPQLTSLLAAARADEFSRAAERKRSLADEPTGKLSATRRGWFWPPRLVRLPQQECVEHQL